jgi:hypothetical protein
VHLGLTISDYGTVPQITDCLDHKIIIIESSRMASLRPSRSPPTPSTF